MNPINSLLARFRKAAPPPPPITHWDTSATVACLVSCLAFRKERNRDGLNYTYKEMDALANEHLLGYCREWDKLMEIIEADARSGARYKIAGYDEDDALLANRIAPGAAAVCGEFPDTEAVTRGREQKIVWGVVAVLAALCKHWGG